MTREILRPSSDGHRALVRRPFGSDLVITYVAEPPAADLATLIETGRRCEHGFTFRVWDEGCTTAHHGPIWSIALIIYQCPVRYFDEKYPLALGIPSLL